MTEMGVGKPAPFLLATVMHTGTHSACSIFEPYYKRCAITENGLRDYEPYTGEAYWFSHCDQNNMGAIRGRAKSCGTLILTMRHPMAVAQSWTNRGMVMDDRFRNMWENLFALQKAHDGLWLPVDTPDRDMRLTAISERLGVVLSTDWVPLEHMSVKKPFKGGMTLGDCKEFYTTLPFAQFGYNLDEDGSMNYREMQIECKRRGLPGNGTKAVLRERLYADSDPQIKPVTNGAGKSFVFTGDPVNGQDPDSIVMFSYRFTLNGDPVGVSDELAARLINNSHFTAA